MTEGKTDFAIKSRVVPFHPNIASSCRVVSEPYRIVSYGFVDRVCGHRRSTNSHETTRNRTNQDLRLNTERLREHSHLTLLLP